MIELRIATNTAIELAAVLALLKTPDVSIFSVDVSQADASAKMQPDEPADSADTCTQQAESVVPVDNIANTEAPKKKAVRPRKADPINTVEMATVQPDAVVQPTIATQPITKEPTAVTQTEQSTATQQAVPITIDDVRTALTRISETAGIAKAKELLEQFGVKRASDLVPAKYPEFLALAAEVSA